MANFKAHKAELVSKLEGTYENEFLGKKMPKGGMSRSYSRRFDAPKVADRTLAKPKVDRSKTEIFLRAKSRPVIRKEMTVLARLMTYARHYKFSYRMTATRWVMVWPTFEVEFMSAAEMVKFVESVG